MRLKNKVAIVTGAASGIGKSIAEKFIGEGAQVVFSDVNGDNSLVSDFKEKAIFIKCDVSKSEEVDNLIDQTVKQFGKVDIMVNNAGIVKFGAIHETSEADWDAVLDINLKSIFLTSKKVIPEMIKQGQGKIINITSIAGLVGFESVGPYCASKGGIIGLSREMALEYAKQKINVNCIAPGIIKTAMTKDLLDNPAQREGLASQTPYPRFGEPEDIAYAAIYLASDESDFVTGHTMVIDGGWIAR